MTAIYSEEPTFGFGWRPVATANREMSKAICVWLNSTPGRLLLLNRRAKTLTYPSWSTTHWKEILIPRHAVGIRRLAEVFETVARLELKTLQFANTDEARKLIDDVAAEAVGLDRNAVADWRRRLAAEPTITNRRADDRQGD